MKSQTFDIFPFDLDVFVSVRSGLLVPEAKNVDELVLDDSALHAGRSQADVAVGFVMRSANGTLASLARVEPNVLLA